MEIGVFEPRSDFVMPVSVVVAHQQHKDVRHEFYNRFVHRSILAACPTELVLVKGPEGAAAKRNAGAAQARSEFLVLWDDDCVMASDYLIEMVAALVTAPRASFAYCDALEIVHPDAPKHPTSSVKIRRSKAFDEGALVRGNYISNMSIMRRADFPGCDTRLKRLIDWNMWLTMVKRGKTGVHVPKVLYHAYYLDAGVTASSISYQQAVHEVRRCQAEIK